jgi:hypothetical protein
MSSRVRMLWQDFSTGQALTGKAAFVALQAVYQNWVKAQTRSKKEIRAIWHKVTPQEAEAHPYVTENFLVEVPDCVWEGPGHYQQRQKTQEIPARILQPLPTGPKWLVAMEMWARLSPTYDRSYKLFVSRDGRKHAWRYSLCNPFFQGWGYKVRVPKPKKSKKPINKLTGRTYALDDFGERTYGAGLAAPVASTPKAVKPRVGIWT